jgi:outer membrane protein OmpA-like peptidoglycan-associated protein
MTLSTTAAMTGAALLLLLAPFAQASDPLPARAGEFSLKLEPGVAIPLTHPQSQLFKVGGSGTIKALWSLNEYLDLGPSATFLALPTASSQGESGRAWAYGGGLRLKRPHTSPDNDSLYAISPWLDADALYVRTGKLDRFGFAVGAGLAVPIGVSRAVWIGPFVRYFHITQPDRAGYDNGNARILSVGISLEVGSGVRREGEAVAAAEVPTPCRDRDNDGVCDDVDRCPDVAGPADNFGCPPYKRLVVKPDKLELKEKIFFEWDKAIIQQVSYPVLNEVAQALKDNRSFRVQVEGHASSEGAYDYNQALSERRAEAVLDYIVARGVAKERLVSKGFSSSVPVASNVTEAGREQNRRVEFIVHFIIVNDGSK